MKVIRNEKEFERIIDRIEELAENITIARPKIHTEDLLSEDNIFANALEISYQIRALKELK